jgi:hypothetical protein
MASKLTYEESKEKHMMIDKRSQKNTISNTDETNTQGFIVSQCTEAQY